MTTIKQLVESKLNKYELKDYVIDLQYDSDEMGAGITFKHLNDARLVSLFADFLKATVAKEIVPSSKGIFVNIY